MGFWRFVFLVWAAFWLVRALRRALRVAEAEQRARGRVAPPFVGVPPFAQNRPPPPPPPPRQPARASPYEVLEVQPGSSMLQIRRAYQAKVQQYHPDQVAHLGSELREVAERRTKEINAAYNYFKQSGLP
jgi:DnaJ-domain-containing protein 1